MSQVKALSLCAHLGLPGSASVIEGDEGRRILSVCSAAPVQFRTSQPASQPDLSPVLPGIFLLPPDSSSPSGLLSNPDPSS